MGEFGLKPWWVAGIVIAAVGAVGATAVILMVVNDSGQGGNSDAWQPYDKVNVEWRDTPDDVDLPSEQSRNGCEVTPLPVPDSDDHGGEIAGVSASGNYLVGEVGTDKLLWHDGKYQVLGDRHSDISVADVNSAGTVVGTVEPGNGQQHPFVYRDGEFAKLAVPDAISEEMGGSPSYGLEIVGINDNGDIAGSGYYDDGLSRESRDGFNWDADAPARQPFEFDGAVMDMNNDGSFAVSAEGDKWIVDTKGKGPKVPDRYIEDFSGDWLVSDSEVWNVTSPDDLRESEIGQVNVLDATGRAYGAFGAETGTTPGAEIDGEAVELPALSDKEGTSNVWGVTEVSEDGKVMVGKSMDSDETNYAVRWSC